MVSLPTCFRKLAKSESTELSGKAKLRLKVLDRYRHNSPHSSANGKPDANLTCRHFGIHRSMFYRWSGRFEPKRPASLEDKSRAPKRKRGVEYSRELVRQVREIRKANPTYSARKIRPILLRTMAEDKVPSVTTLGRLISRNDLFFRPDTKSRKKRSRAARRAHERLRKPYDLKAGGPGQVIEFDMKHVYLLGTKLYAFCAIDVFSKDAVVHIASSPSSRNARVCAEAAVARFGKSVSFVNDNGSENMKEVREYLASQGITQYWAHPHSPKEKPFVERFIGTMQREFLDYRYEPMNVTEMQAEVSLWLEKYRSYRPHESPGFLTPAEFSASLKPPVPQGGVS